MLGRSPLAGGGPELLPTKSSVKPSRCSQPETSISPGSVRNHQPWTPACSGTGHGSLNTSSRVKRRAARKSLTSVTRWLSDMTTPIVVPVPRAVGSAEGGGDRRQVEVVPPHGDLAVAHLEDAHDRQFDLCRRRCAASRRCVRSSPLRFAARLSWRCTWKSMPSNPCSMTVSRNSLIASRPWPAASECCGRRASSVKWLTISSGSGFDHSVQNSVTTSSACVMP